LLDVQELHGVLCHICFVYREGRSRLAVFSNAITGFKNTFQRRWLSGTAHSTLIWWENTLSDAFFSRELRPLGRLHDLGIYVDASTSWGLAVVVGDLWYALRLKTDWKSIMPGYDICWLEAVAIEVLFLFLEQLGYHDIYVLVRSDNKGAIGVHEKGRSPNLGLNLCARRAFVITSGLAITPEIVYVASADNLADALSRGESAPHIREHNRLERRFELPAELRCVFVDELHA
jgi:hypothetical protein